MCFGDVLVYLRGVIYRGRDNRCFLIYKVRMNPQEFAAGPSQLHYSAFTMSYKHFNVLKKIMKASEILFCQIRTN